MKGKYINTTIMIAALSGGKRKRANAAETIATINDHKIIWSKNNPTKTTAVAEPQTLIA